MKYIILAIVVFTLSTSCKTISDVPIEKHEYIGVYDIKLIRIPSGILEMGSNKGGDDEVPVHKVQMKSFYIAETEITQKTYYEVMKENPSQNGKDENCPVDTISWMDAILFCNKLSLIEGLKPVYQVNENGQGYYDMGNNGYRLLTEAEWEYCAKMDKGYIKNKLDDIAWYSNNANGITHPVGQKKPNAYGVYDLLGNISEWCWDEYKESYKPMNKKNQNDKYDTRTVYRGGCYISLPMFLTTTKRYFTQLYFKQKNIGIRVARTMIQ
jgi:formylglycine-generating enzyme required for sulfatase activity